MFTRRNRVGSSDLGWWMITPSALSVLGIRMAKESRGPQLDGQPVYDPARPKSQLRPATKAKVISDIGRLDSTRVTPYLLAGISGKCPATTAVNGID